MTQTDAILRHLRLNGSITPLEALREYGCFRLAARVWDLRQQGHDIRETDVLLPNGKRIASYSLVEKPEQLSWTA